MATAITLTPGRATLADWRAVADGAAVHIDRTALPQVEAGARAVAAILAKGEPVYGINTGFGRLAHVRIAAADLAALQRNLVLSHAAGVGEPMRSSNRAADDGAQARLPRPRRLGRAAGDHRDAGSHAGARRDPGGPVPGLGRRVGRSRAARPHDRGDARRRRGRPRRRADAGGRGAGARRTLPDHARRQGRARDAQRHAVLDRGGALPACSRSSACSRRRSSPARSRPMRREAPTRRSIRASTRCAATAGRSRSPRPCAR